MYLLSSIKEGIAIELLDRIFFMSFSRQGINYCPFDICRKDVFVWRITLNENILFSLSISHQKPVVFSVSVFYSQIFTVKLNLRPKIGLTYAIFTVKRFFGCFVYENIFFNFHCWILIIDVSQQHCENFRKNEQAEVVENLPPSYLPYRFLHNLHSFLLWEKVKIFDLIKSTKNNDYNKTFCA